MNLIFLKPFFLYFLPLSLLPLILHLIIAKRKKILFLPSIIFWKKILKEKKNIWKLKNILLIIVRTLLIFSLILLFSEPILQFGKNIKKKKNYIFVDRSYSMFLKEGNKRLKEKSREILNSILKNLKGEFVSLYFFDEKLEKIFSGVLKDLNFLNEENFLSYKPGNFKTVLKEFSNKEKQSRVIIISDFNENNFSEIKDLSLFNRFFNIFVVLGNEIENSSVAKILEEHFSDEGEIYLKVKIKSGGNSVLSVFSNGIKRYSTILNKEKTSIAKDIFFKDLNKKVKFSYGYIKISKDLLPEDNVYYFSIKKKKKIKIGILNGSPSNIFYKDSVFYLKKVFELEKAHISQCSLDIYQDKDSFFDELEKFDIVFLVDVKELKKREVKKLWNKKVIVFAGENFIKGNYNEWDFIPAGIYGVKEEKREIILNKSYFNEFENEFFKNISLKKFLKMKPYLKTDVLLKTELNEPLLVSYKNKFFIFGFTANDLWSEFPLKGEYPVFIRKIIEKATKGKEMNLKYFVGDKLSFEEEQGNFENIKFLNPDKRQLKLNFSYSGRKVFVESEELKIPGIYFLEIYKKNKIEKIPVAVNLNRRTGESEIKKVNFSIFNGIKYYKLKPDKNFGKKIAAILKGKFLNKYIFISILILFIAEIFISRL